MQLSYAFIALLALAGFGAGFVDSIAGGGGLITVPTLFATGMPPIMALATNKVQSSVGTALASWRFWRTGLIDVRHLLPAIAATAVGSFCGVLLVQHIHLATLKLVIPLLMLAAIIYFIFSPKMSDADSHARLSMAAYASVALCIGFYDGFFGPGTGSFFAASLVALTGMGLLRATGHTKLLNLTSNSVAVLLFVQAGAVIWPIAMIMGLANIAGAWCGSHLALKQGARIIRPLLILVSLALTVRTLLDPANPMHSLLLRQ